MAKDRRRSPVIENTEKRINEGKCVPGFRKPVTSKIKNLNARKIAGRIDDIPKAPKNLPGE